MIIAMYTGMALAAIKLVSCILLLYGALMRARHYLLPWVSIVLIEMVFTFSAIVACLAFGSFRHFTIGLFACGVVQLMLAFYLWLAVFSFYRQLYEDEVINGSVREVTTANAMKTGYLQFSGKPYNV
ncbi:hypothetical protein B566_EDAN009984 [Ephemera danica]|nr:hypothetical protein B566_EDAN009984 [Ephemera danica]